MFSHEYDHFKNIWLKEKGIVLEDFVNYLLAASTDIKGRLENLISFNTSFYKHTHGNILVGRDVRVDDFCFISIGASKSVIGSFIHIAPFCSLSISNGFLMGDFSGLSTGVKIFTSSSDYSGEYLSHPPAPIWYRNPTQAPVIIGRHCIIGAGSVIMPGVHIPDGVAIGALSFVNQDLEPWGIYAGTPVKKIKDRSRNCLQLEEQLLNDLYQK